MIFNVLCKYLKSFTCWSSVPFLCRIRNDAGSFLTVGPFSGPPPFRTRLPPRPSHGLQDPLLHAFRVPPPFRTGHGGRRRGERRSGSETGVQEPLGTISHAGHRDGHHQVWQVNQSWYYACTVEHLFIRFSFIRFLTSVPNHSIAF